MKLTTKLVLGATVVVGLSVSAFAACANNVEMGGKQLKDVAEPTVATDAATKGYVDGITLTGTMDSHYTGTATARKFSNGLVCIALNNVRLVDSNITDQTPIATFSEGIGGVGDGHQVLTSISGADTVLVRDKGNNLIGYAGNQIAVGQIYYANWCW